MNTMVFSSNNTLVFLISCIRSPLGNMNYLIFPGSSKQNVQHAISRISEENGESNQLQNVAR